MEAQVELAIVTVEEEGRVIERRILAAVAPCGIVARRAMHVLTESAVTLSTEVHREVVATNMVVCLASGSDAELKVMNPLLQVLKAVMGLVVEVCVRAIDRAEVAAACRTLDLELRALQVIVVALMFSKDAHSAAVRTLDKLFGTFTQMA